MSSLTLSRTSTSIFYVDSGASPPLRAAYASYKVENNDAMDHQDLWLSIGNFSGGNVGLAQYESGIFHLGALADGASGTAFFYLQATATAAPQAHTLSVYPSQPPAFPLLSRSFTFSAVQETIFAASNQVDIVVSGPNPGNLGGAITMQVGGRTGTMDSAPVLAFSPACYLDWPAHAYQLYNSEVTFYGANASVHTDMLLLPSYVTSTADTAYTAVYRFRATSSTAQPSTISPIAYLQGGGPIKHTQTGGYIGSDFLPTGGLVNSLTLSKTAAASLWVWPAPLEYTLNMTNTDTADATVQQFRDDFAGSPGMPQPVTGTSFWGTQQVADPVVSGTALVWNGLFTVPAQGEEHLSFQVAFPQIAGTYPNQAIAMIGTTQLDRTLDATDNSPTAASVVLLMPTPTPTFTITPTFTATPSSTPTPSITPTSTGTQSFTHTPSFSHSPTITETATISPTFSVSPTFSHSPTITQTFSVSPTFSHSPTSSATPTASPTSSATPTRTRTGTRTPSFTRTITLTRTPTPVLSQTPSTTLTSTPAGSSTPTPTRSPSHSHSPTATPTASPSATPSHTPSSTRTFTASATASPSLTPTLSFSASPSFTPSPTPSVSPTISPSFTESRTHTHSPTASPSFTDSPTPTDSPTATPTGTPTATRTASPTPTPTRTPTATRTDSPTATATRTASPTPSITPTFSVSPTASPSFTDSPTSSATPSATQSFTPVDIAALGKPRPNPLRPLKGETLSIPFEVSTRGGTRIKVFNLAGELVRTLLDADLGNGPHSISWDGRNQKGDLVASGLYLILFESPGKVQRSLVGVVK